MTALVPFGVRMKRHFIPPIVAIPAALTALALGAPGFIFTQDEIGQFAAPVAASLNEAWQQATQNFSIKMPIVGEALAAEKQSPCVPLASQTAFNPDISDGVYFDLSALFGDKTICTGFIPAMKGGTPYWNGYDTLGWNASPPLPPR